MNAILFLLALLGVPTPDDAGACLYMPPAPWVYVDYQGATNLWIVDDEIIGASVTEDSCIRPRY